MELRAWREMPIGGLILEAGNAAEYATGNWRAFRPVRGEAGCSNCLLCWLYCPDSSVLVNAEQGTMVGFDLDHCKGCGICAAVCPVNTRAARDAQVLLARDDPRLCIYMAEEGRFLE
jgi:pyruvate ferredoxin oxidoreductase delta subunit